MMCCAALQPPVFETCCSGLLSTGKLVKTIRKFHAHLHITRCPDLQAVAGSTGPHKVMLTPEIQKVEELHKDFAWQALQKACTRK